MVVNETVIIGLGVGVLNLVIGLIIFYLSRPLAGIPMIRVPWAWKWKSATQLSGGSEKKGEKGMRFMGLALAAFGSVFILLGLIAALTGADFLAGF
jgi:hypothetical protein